MFPATAAKGGRRLGGDRTGRPAREPGNPSAGEGGEGTGVPELGLDLGELGVQLLQLVLSLVLVLVLRSTGMRVITPHAGTSTRSFPVLVVHYPSWVSSL